VVAPAKIEFVPMLESPATRLPTAMALPPASVDRAAILKAVSSLRAASKVWPLTTLPSAIKVPTCSTVPAWNTLSAPSLVPAARIVPSASRECGAILLPKASTVMRSIGVSSVRTDRWSISLSFSTLPAVRTVSSLQIAARRHDDRRADGGVAGNDEAAGRSGAAHDFDDVVIAIDRFRLHGSREWRTQ